MFQVGGVSGISNSSVSLIDVGADLPVVGSYEGLATKPLALNDLVIFLEISYFNAISITLPRF